MPSATLTASSGPTSTFVSSLPDLVVRYISIEPQTGGACNSTSTELGTRVIVKNIGQAGAGPFAVQVATSQQVVPGGLAVGATASLWFPGYAYGAETIVTVDAALQVTESDENNNTLAQMVPIPTLPPPCTPSPTGTPPTRTPSPTSTRPPTTTPTITPVPTPTRTPHPPAVTVREGQITLPTYPYARFTTQVWNSTFNMPYSTLDRQAYLASNPQPSGVLYRTIELENTYLKLTFLPDLGGRLYEVVFKPTGHRETYRNPVLKPSPWGPPEQGWGLAAGGIEWCFPVEEHGYEWGIPWSAEVSQNPSGATVTLRDSAANDRVRATVTVRLEADAASFTVRPRLENPTGTSLAVKYWSNAMLAPGGQNAPSASLRFVLPTAVTSVTVHSRGDDFLPGPGQRMPWPVAAERDLSRLGNWNRWLGFFEDPAVGDFAAVYDEIYDEGMVHVALPDDTPGIKVFAFGWVDPIPAGNWTDDGSSYVELHAGPASTFDDSLILPAGGHAEWTEVWYPVAGLGSLRYANSLAALNLSAGGGQAQFAIAVTRLWNGNVTLFLEDQAVWRSDVVLSPGQPLRTSYAFDPTAPPAGMLTLRLAMPDGSVAAEYSAEFALK